MDGFDLGIGILFPRLPVGQRARPGDELDRAGLGRQRDLAGARRRRAARRLPARLCDHPAGALRAADRDAARPGLPRRRLRVPLARSGRTANIWDAGFFLGSLVATFAQGITLGALLQGIAVEGRAYAGGWWDWLTPFSLLTGASLVVGYALLGACWLIWKTEGPLQARARRHAAWLLPAFARRDRRGQPRDAVRRVRNISSAGSTMPGPARHRADAAAGPSASRFAPVARPRRAARDWLPFAADAGPVPARHGRPRHLDLARRDPRPGDDLAGGGAAFEPALHAGRRGWCWCR